MRICFLTHYYAPEVGAPQTRIALLAGALSTAGHDVVVHTGFPHYPDGRIPPPFRNRPWSVAEHDGVRVVRSAVYAAPNRGFARRIADHTAFAASALATAWLTGPLDVVIVESPPLFTAAAGVPYAAAKRAALIVNVADRWPESAIQLGALSSPRAIAVAEALERWIYRRADAITTPTAGLHRELGGVAGAEGKVHRTWPVVDVDRFTPDPAAGGNPQGPLRLLYAGTLGLAQGLDVLLEASRLAGPEVVKTTIAGGGADADHLAAELRDRAIGNARLIGAVPATEIPRLHAEADAAAVLLKDVPLFERALPTKTFEAMAAGNPVLLSAGGEIADLIRDQEAGLVCAPGDAGALAATIRRLHEDRGLAARLGAAGRRFVQTRLGAANAAAEWSALIGEVAARHRGGVLAAYRAYAADPRKQRAWSAENPGNVMIRRELVEAVGEIAGAQLAGARRVLDAGCGTGWFLEALTGLVAPGCERHGIDLLPERAAAAAGRSAGAAVIAGDLSALPYPDGHFDAVVMLTVLSSIDGEEAIDAALAEVRRVLAPGGSVLVWEPRLANPRNPHTTMISAGRLRAALGPVEARRSLTLLPPLARRLGARTEQRYGKLAALPLLRTHQLICLKPPR